MAWKAIARSATGTSHQKQQLPCQDYGDYQILNEVIIGSVADGAGSAKHAEVGAKLAVKTVLEYLTDVEQWLQKRQKFEKLIQKPPSEAEARKLFVKTASKVVTALQAQAAAPHLRPTAQEWRTALKVGLEDLIVCRNSASHYQLFKMVQVRIKRKLLSCDYPNIDRRLRSLQTTIE